MTRRASIGRPTQQAIHQQSSAIKPSPCVLSRPSLTSSRSLKASSYKRLLTSRSRNSAHAHRCYGVHRPLELFVPFPRGDWFADDTPLALVISSSSGQTIGCLTCGVLDGLTKSRDTLCTKIPCHVRALIERGRVIMNEGRGRDNVFVRDFARAFTLYRRLQHPRSAYSNKF